MTEPPLNLDNGFTVSVYFPPGSDPHWVSEFLSRISEDAHSMPSDSLDAFVVGHARDMLGIDDERAAADSYAAMVNAPLRPETARAIGAMIKSGKYSRRKVKRRQADDESATCPTACEPDCRDVCHEDHRVRGERDHEPDRCPGFRPTRWPFWPRNPSWMGKPLPTMRETSQQALDDLAERGIRLVVPGYDTPPAPVWPHGVPRGDLVTVFANDWPDDPPPVREMTAEEAARILPKLATDGVDTPGCDCGHDGLGVRWHASDCVWRNREQR